MDDLAKTNLLAYHIFTEPDPSAGIDIDADADTMQGRAEKVDTVPTPKRLVSHAFLNGGHTSPGGRIRSCLADIFSAVAQAGKAFIGNALPGCTPIRTGMAEATVHHVPAMQQCARGQGSVPGERRQATGGTIVVDQLEELLGELLRLSGDRRWPIGGCQCPVLWRNRGRLLAVRDAVGGWLWGTRTRRGTRTGSGDVRSWRRQ